MRKTRCDLVSMTLTSNCDVNISACLGRKDGEVRTHSGARKRSWIDMTARQRNRDSLPLPVTKSQVLAVAGLDKHHLGTEEQLLHDVCEQPGIHLWVGEALGQPAAVLNQLVATGNAVPMKIQDGDAQGGAGGLASVEEERSTQ